MSVAYVAVQVFQMEIVTATATSSMSVVYVAVQVSLPETVTVTAINSTSVVFVEDQELFTIVDVLICLQATVTVMETS